MAAGVAREPRIAAVVAGAGLAGGGEARDEAEALAKQSIALGPKSGPLCRRNWTLVKLLRDSRGEVENAASAAAMLERCTIAPPVRM